MQSGEKGKGAVVSVDVVGIWSGEVRLRFLRAIIVGDGQINKVH